MAKKNDEELYDAAIAMIGSVTKLPAIRVDKDKRWRLVEIMERAK